MTRLQIDVEGIVQGVGFRPFVYSAAIRLGLVGSVRNTGQGVLIEVEGERVEDFLTTLRDHPPPLAWIDRLSSRQLHPLGSEQAFTILPSSCGARRTTLISPDTATCEDCLQEIFDPSDRRYRYAFTNCTNCGPRFTIVRGLPYDRAKTTMASFPMCADCLHEYADPLNRRFHAQPVACPACGPQLRLCTPQGQTLPGDPLRETARLLREGHIVAIKGLGGYHLAVDAYQERAVARLRARKHREEKPFAVMAADLEGVLELAEVTPLERDLLTGTRRPIVLLKRRPQAAVAPSVAPCQAELGIMLPYTPLHHLLLAELERPIVLTSGNLSDEPIAYLDDEAMARLGSLADVFLTHDRPIHVRTDDSVVRTFRGAPLPLRRSRGYVPQPVTVPLEFSRPVLACGGELKATLCLGRGRQAFLSHHLGDLENLETYTAFRESIEHFQGLLDLRPQLVAHDLHPEYLSTKWALDQDLETVGVQHHHAHVVACMAENGESAAVIGVALDGLGYGPDGTLWGGEFLRCQLDSFERLGCLAPVPMPGGAAAIRQPWRMAVAYLGEEGPRLELHRRHESLWGVMRQLRSLQTSSMGRLFDAVAAILDLRDEVAYEGQAAIMLEQLADPADRGTYPASFEEVGGEFRVRGADLAVAVAEELGLGRPREAIAGRFHNAVADLVVEGCRRCRQRTALTTVALSGGVYQNMLLLEKSVDRLEAEGFRVLRHRLVPPNDGGLSLGQAVVAGALGSG